MSIIHNILFIALLLVSYSIAIELKAKSNTSQIRTNTQIVPDEDLSSEELLEKYSKARGINCNEANCPYPSICSTKDTCNCYWNFLNYKTQDNANDNTYCSYEQKKQSFAFFWEFNFGAFGVGHFYAGRVLHGVLKLFLNLAPCLISCLIMCFGSGFDALKDSSWKIIVNCAVCCSCLGLHLYDLIAFGNNWLKDGNGMPLAPWDIK